MQTPSHPLLTRLNACDVRLCLRLNRLAHRPVVRRFFRVISRLGDGVFWYALMLALLAFVPGALPGVLHMIGVGLAGLVVYRLLKQRTLRPRPCDLEPAILRGTDPLDEFSFPSGHTLHAVAFTVVALAHFPWLSPLLVPFTLLVALSRVLLGLHYPTDVVAGAALGWGLATLSFLLF
ncbi:MAG: phosphatase PAP2 family protein [Burkholderiales bacterium]|jgi:undecaprenyl-diphosphatase|nr:phosphatase PAP2 family protein [Burkholderiales bacterium]